MNQDEQVLKRRGTTSLMVCHCSVDEFIQVSRIQKKHRPQAPWDNAEALTQASRTQVSGYFAATTLMDLRRGAAGTSGKSR